MTRRDARAALGCALGITGLILLLLDLHDGLHGQREGGRNPQRERRRDPRLTLFPRRDRVGSATGGGR
jgi:hypothetical protein